MKEPEGHRAELNGEGDESRRVLVQLTTNWRSIVGWRGGTELPSRGERDRSRRHSECEPEALDARQHPLAAAALRVALSILAFFPAWGGMTVAPGLQRCPGVLRV